MLRESDLDFDSELCRKKGIHKDLMYYGVCYLHVKNVLLLLFNCTKTEL